MGRSPALNEADVIEIMKDGSRPVWTAKDIEKRPSIDASRKTVKKWLDKLAEDDKIEKIKVGSTNAYYLVGVETRPSSNGVESLKEDLKRWAEDRYVGIDFDPTTAIHPNDGRAEAGDKIQIEVRGRSIGEYGMVIRRHYEDRVDNLDHMAITDDSVQALITGELYAKPTVPIEHTEYVEDYDLESNIGVEEVDIDGDTALLAFGQKRNLIKPYNDAVFLKNVEVEEISPFGEGEEMGDAYLAEGAPAFPNKESPKEILERMDADDIPSI